LILSLTSKSFGRRAALVFFLIIPFFLTECATQSTPEYTIEIRQIIPVAGCDGGIPRSNVDLPLQNSPTLACVGTSLADLPERIPSARNVSEYEFGTIIVLSISTEKVVVAADSRATLVSPQTGDIVGYDDTACKVIEINPKLLFAVTGMAATGRAVPADIQYDAVDVARQISRNFRFNPKWMQPNRTIEEIAQVWGWEVDFRIRRGVERGLLKPLGPVWLEGIFVGLEPSSEINVAIAKLEYGKPRTGFIVPPVQLSIESPVPPKSFTWLQSSGLNDATETFYDSHRVTEATKFEYTRIREEINKTEVFPSEIPERLVELTIQHHDRLLKQGKTRGLFVNGPIDLAVLTRNKNVQWIKRKQNCAT
jgi:hypothetical protein